MAELPFYRIKNQTDKLQELTNYVCIIKCTCVVTVVLIVFYCSNKKCTSHLRMRTSSLNAIYVCNMIISHKIYGFQTIRASITYLQQATKRKG